MLYIQFITRRSYQLENKSYKHWVIIAVLCCLSASSIGLCTNSVGVFYVPVSESLHVLKGTFALHATLSSLATAFVSLLMPRLMKRYRYKLILIVGVFLTVVSTLLMALSQSVWLFYGLGIMRGIGVAMYGMVPLTMIITNWFVEKHGLATSIALSFSGLSGAIFSPMLSHWITTMGWQKAYLMMAVCIFVLTLPALLYSWSIDPQDMKLHPYGYQAVMPKTTFTPQTKINVFSIGFICMCILTVLHTSITGISQHLSGMATSVGLSSSIGAMMISLAMFGNISTKLLIGFMSDLLTPVKASIIMIMMNMTSLFFLYNGMSLSQPVVLLVSSFAFGSIYSVGAVGIPLLTRYFFGADNYSYCYSIIGFLTNVGSSSSLAFIGYAYDFTGSYDIVMFIAIGFHIVNLFLLTIVYWCYRRKYNPYNCVEKKLVSTK